MLQIRVYFRDTSQVLREICSTGSNPNWKVGDLDKENFKLDDGAGMDAVVDENTKQLKVYALKRGEKNPTIWYTNYNVTTGKLWWSHPIIGNS